MDPTTTGRSVPMGLGTALLVTVSGLDLRGSLQAGSSEFRHRRSALFDRDDGKLISFGLYAATARTGQDFGEGCDLREVHPSLTRRVTMSSYDVGYNTLRR